MCGKWSDRGLFYRNKPLFQNKPLFCSVTKHQNKWNKVRFSDIGLEKCGLAPAFGRLNCERV